MPESSNLDLLSADSERRSKELEALILRSLSFPAPMINRSKFFIATVDLATDLFYSPVSNLEASILASVFAESGSHLLLETIRNKFPISISRTKAMSLLCSELKNCRSPQAFDEQIFLVEIKEDARIGSIHSYPEQIETLINERHRLDQSTIGEKVNKVLELLRSQEGTNARKYLIIKPDETLEDNATARRFELFQVGFLISSTPKEEEIYPALRDAARISRFATLMLFYEKERYFQKALRQGARGTIVKFGQEPEIIPQLKILVELRKNQKYCVPDILQFDTEIQMGSKRDLDPASYAWYQMTRFTLPSLLDLLTATKGLQDYEVVNLARSSFVHVRDTYWLDDRYLVHSNAKASTAAALAFALRRTHEASAAIKKGTSSIRERMPIKSRRGIDFIDHHVLKQIEGVESITAAEDSRFTISTSWSIDKTTRLCKNPETILKELIQAISQVDSGTELLHCAIRNGRLHGDSHFGNILVDASVPEDPFIVSIDPAKIDLDSNYRDSLFDLMRRDIPENDFQIEAFKLSKDFSLDVAKMMLSSACCYGLVYRRAFGLRTSTRNKKGKQLSFTLHQVGEEQVTKLSEVGGISGSQLVTIDAPVPVDALRYHRVAAEVIFREFSLLLESMLPEGPLRAPSQNMIFTRLWLFTARHAFSISDILFPRDPARAATMYVLSTLFVNKGFSLVLRSIKSQFREPLEQTEWTNIFLPLGNNEPN